MKSYFEVMLSQVRNVLLLSSLVGGVWMMTGCQKKEAAAPEMDAKLAVQFTPNPPVVGQNDIEITATDAAGQPVQLGMIKVEGNMNHAGMKPVFAELIENEAGKYAGTIEFTMAGDWVLLVTSEASAEGSLNKKIDVPGVKAK
jgi:hypothetical protein